MELLLPLTQAHDGHAAHLRVGIVERLGKDDDRPVRELRDVELTKHLHVLRAGRRVRLRPQLLLQDLLQPVVMAQGGGRLPRGGQQADQLPVRFLAERVRADRPMRVLERALHLALLLQKRHQLVQRLETALGQHFPLVENLALPEGPANLVFRAIGGLLRRRGR